jgi:hypothetical protein
VQQDRRVSGFPDGVDRALHQLPQGQSDGFRDSAQMIVGEMVAVAAEFPGESPLAEPLALGGRVLEDKGRVAEQARVGPGAFGSAGIACWTYKHYSGRRWAPSNVSTA